MVTRVVLSFRTFKVKKAVYDGVEMIVLSATLAIRKKEKRSLNRSRINDAVLRRVKIKPTFFRNFQL